MKGMKGEKPDFKLNEQLMLANWFTHKKRRKIVKAGMCVSHTSEFGLLSYSISTVCFYSMRWMQSSFFQSEKCIEMICLLRRVSCHHNNVSSEKLLSRTRFDGDCVLCHKNLKSRKCWAVSTNGESTQSADAHIATLHMASTYTVYSMYSHNRHLVNKKHIFRTITWI